MSAATGRRVVVVGAGLAGLVSARELSRRGANVTVLEARDRLGGRVWTWRPPSLAPFHVEAGGEFIDGEHASLRALVRTLGLRLVRVVRDGFGLAVQIDGRVRRSRRQSAYWNALAKPLRFAAEAFQRSNCDWNGTVAAVVGRRSLREALDAAGASPRAHVMAEALRGFYLADPEQLSALVAVEQVLEGSDPGSATMFRIDGGNDRLVDTLSRRTKAQILTRHAVRAVQHDERTARLTVEDAGGLRSHIDADYVVCTVPVPALLEWQMDPPFPENQQRALMSLRYGSATKAFLRFPDRWWRRTGRPNAYGTNLPVGAVWEAAEEQRGASILTLLAGGSASAALQQLLGAGADDVMSQLSWLGKASGVPSEAPSVTWENDEWARGGYAVTGPGFEPAWQALLSRAHGRLVFAGEHTSREWQGFMNGAVESGQRAASEVEALAALKPWRD